MLTQPLNVTLCKRKKNTGSEQDSPQHITSCGPFKQTQNKKYLFNMFTLVRTLLRLRLSLNESQWHLSQQPHAWLAPTPANGVRRYLDACSAAGLLCLEQTPVLQPPRAPLYSRPGAGPVLLVPAIWSKPEGENLSKRADLKSAAMFPDAVCARASAPRDRPPGGNNARAPNESAERERRARASRCLVGLFYLIQ